MLRCGRVMRQRPAPDSPNCRLPAEWTRKYLSRSARRICNWVNRRALSRAFDQALQIDPDSPAAAAGRVAALNAAPKLEAAAWYGSTSNADSGLRLVEVGWWAGRDTRLSARYDDSLSLDNPAIVRRGESARTYLAGVHHAVNDKLAVLSRQVFANFRTATRICTGPRSS